MTERHPVAHAINQILLYVFTYLGILLCVVAVVLLLVGSVSLIGFLIFDSFMSTLT